MTVSGKYSQNVRTGEKLHLAISAFADTFASDPDVYISKVSELPANFPTLSHPHTLPNPNHLLLTDDPTTFKLEGVRLVLRARGQ